MIYINGKTVKTCGNVFDFRPGNFIFISGKAEPLPYSFLLF